MGKKDPEPLESNVRIRARIHSRIDNKAQNDSQQNDGTFIIYQSFCIPEVFAFFFVLFFLMCILYVKGICIKKNKKQTWQMKTSVIPIQLH